MNKSVLSTENICAWYAEDGIHLAKGSSAIDSPRAQIVSWETVAERIGELLENGRFATNVELVEASGYERQKLAESLWHLYHDLSEEARSSNYLAILHQEPFRGFPDETADLAEKLRTAVRITMPRVLLTPRAVAINCRCPGRRWCRESTV